MILGQQTILKLILIVLLVLALSSCASVKEKAEVSLEEEESEIIAEKAASAEGDVRKPIYVYENQPKKVSLKEITLTMHSEPLLLPNGYVRLVGVVSGGRPMALIEVGGRGLCVDVGDEIGKYRVAWISREKIKLVRKGEDQ
ncbi:MAG: hypothetical protein V3T21_02350 [Candidatus Margulisiibacteriota bacterium]